MDDDEKHSPSLAALTLLLQKHLKLTDLIGEAFSLKLSPQEKEELRQALDTMRRVGAGVAQTIAGVPNDFYDQLLASTERYRHETERANDTLQRVLDRRAN